MFRSILTITLASGLLAQAPPAAKKAAPAPVAAKPAAGGTVTFDQILQLVKLKLPEAAILKKVSEAKNLNPSADQLIALKSAGASDAVILALTGASAPDPAPATQSVTISPSPAISVTAPRAAAAPTGFAPNLQGVACDAPPPMARKRVVAVEEFDYSTVMTGIQAVFGTQVNIGNGIRAMFVKRIATDGKFRVVERAKINKVMAEQDFGASGRVKKGTNAKIGQIIGSDAILMGDIVVFGRDDRKKSIGGFGVGPRAIAGMKLNLKDDKAVVAINYRLVDAESSEVIATGEARGESNRKSKGFAVGGFGGGGGGAGAVDMTASNFAETIIGEATMAAVDQLNAQLSSQEAKITPKAVEVEGRVAEVAAPQIYLSVGSADGIQKCDRFEISRIVKEVKDPATKEVIDVMTEPVGEMIVTEVRERIAIGPFAGAQAPAQGYIARKK